jgi:hypothetical protein
MLLLFFFIFVAKEICTACSKKNKIVPRTSLKECLYSGKTEIDVNVNNGRGKNKPPRKNTATIGELITAECALVAYVYISLYIDVRSLR